MTTQPLFVFFLFMTTSFNIFCASYECEESESIHLSFKKQGGFDSLFEYRSEIKQVLEAELDRLCLYLEEEETSARWVLELFGKLPKFDENKFIIKGNFYGRNLEKNKVFLFQRSFELSRFDYYLYFYKSFRRILSTRDTHLQRLYFHLLDKYFEQYSSHCNFGEKISSFVSALAYSCNENHPEKSQTNPYPCGEKFTKSIRSTRDYIISWKRMLAEYLRHQKVINQSACDVHSFNKIMGYEGH